MKPNAHFMMLSAYSLVWLKRLKSCTEEVRETRRGRQFNFFISGCSEMLMANAVQRLAATTPGKESMAMESFAKALRQVSNNMTGIGFS